MTFKNWHSYRRILALLLAVCLLAGCTRSPGTTGTSPANVNGSQDYEVYKKESLDAQKSFDELCQTLFNESVTESTINLHYTLADPAAYGITDYPITYGDFSADAMRKNLQSMKEEKAQLDAIDVQLLTEEQQLTYRILEETYETELSSEGLELYYQPLAPTIGIQAQLPVLLAEYVFYDKQDVEDYLNLLSKTKEYFAQLLAFEQEKAAAGLFMTDACLQQVLDSCDAYMLPPDRNFLTETFTERLASLPGLTEEETADYTARNTQVLEESFIPAYQLLSEGLKDLKGTGTNEQGMCHYPEGKAYYEYMVRSATGTTHGTIDQLRDAIQEQMDSDLTAISNIFKKNPDAMEKVVGSTMAERTPEQILDSLISQIAVDFPELPQCSYHVKYVPDSLESSLSPAFYLTPPMDRYQDNTIYINRSNTDQDSQFFTLAHEGYPGHLYQNVYFIDKCTQDLRNVLSFSSYSEGWATYVEHYSYTLDHGLDPDVAQILSHNSSCILGIHAILDLYINYYGWTKEQVAEYLSNYYSLDDNNLTDIMYTTLIANPTNYLEYYVGYLEILQMKELAEKTLGDKFVLKDFHTFLLDIGPAPFTVIEPYFKTWLMTYELEPEP